MKSTIAIGAVVAGIAVLANVGTIYDNACKYIVTCNNNPEPQPSQPAKPEALLICNGRATKLANGTIVCEPAPQKAEAEALPTIAPPAPVKEAGNVRAATSSSRPGKCGEFRYWTPSGCKDARTH